MAIKYYFAGGEIPSHRRLLEENGHRTIAMSYAGLSRRTKFTKPWLAADQFAPSTEILLDSGAYSLNREDAKVTEAGAIAMSVNYKVFVSQNVDRLAAVTEFDALILGDDWLKASREDFYDGLPDGKFIPVWHSLSGQDELHRLAARYGRAGIVQDDADDEDDENALVSLAADGIRLHGMGMTRIGSMRKIAWDSVSSTSWLSPIQYGDLIIWDTNRLHRYPRTRRDRALQTCAAKLDSEGFDVRAIAAGESAELLRLSAWSWSKYVSWINDARPREHAGRSAEPGTALARPQPRERVLLPLIATQAGTGGQEGKPAEPVTAAASATLMNCSNCYIRRECPEFEDGAACKYDIPVQVESANQLRALLSAVIRIQAQRTLVMTMMEQAKGGYADAGTGAEIDRLARLLRLRNDADKSTFTFSVSASGPPDQQAGYLSSVFGKQAGDRATALPAPVTAEQVLAGIVEPEAAR